MTQIELFQGKSMDEVNDWLNEHDTIEVLDIKIQAWAGTFGSCSQVLVIYNETEVKNASPARLGSLLSKSIETILDLLIGQMETNSLDRYNLNSKPLTYSLLYLKEQTGITEEELKEWMELELYSKL